MARVVEAYIGTVREDALRLREEGSTRTMGIAERWRGVEELPADLEGRLAELPKWLADRGVLVGYLFGSAGSKDGGAADVDLALLREGAPVWRLREELWERLGTQRLDLVDLERASPVLRFEVVRNGRLLYARDADTVNRFELSTLHEYRDTAPMRRRQKEYFRKRMSGWS